MMSSKAETPLLEMVKSEGGAHLLDVCRRKMGGSRDP